MNENMTVRSECKPRDMFDAPNFSHRSIIQWLTEKGAKGIINARGVAYIIGCSLRVVKDAERAGFLKPIDKATYQLESVAQWLMKNPRFIAQSQPSWEVDEKMLSDIRNILLARHQTLIAKYNGDVEELVQEIAFRLSRKRRVNISASTAIFSVIADLIRKNNRRPELVPISQIK